MSIRLEAKHHQKSFFKEAIHVIFYFQSKTNLDCMEPRKQENFLGPKEHDKYDKPQIINDICKCIEIYLCI